MKRFETEKNIRRLIEERTGKRIVRFIPRTPENTMMRALMDDGSIIEATSHIEMKRMLERPKKEGLGL